MDTRKTLAYGLAKQVPNQPCIFPSSTNKKYILLVYFHIFSKNKDPSILWRTKRAGREGCIEGGCWLSPARSLTGVRRPAFSSFVAACCREERPSGSSFFRGEIDKGGRRWGSIERLLCHRVPIRRLARWPAETSATPALQFLIYQAMSHTAREESTDGGG